MNYRISPHTIWLYNDLDITLIKRILRWEMQAVQESPIIRELREEWIAKGREEGRAEGRQEGIELGEHKATLEALRQILTIRFKIELDEFDEQLKQLDLESLKKLNEAALTAQSLPEFKGILNDMLSELDGPSAS
jgi:predicted transposase YdaD